MDLIQSAIAARECDGHQLKYPPGCPLWAIFYYLNLLEDPDTCDQQCEHGEPSRTAWRFIPKKWERAQAELDLEEVRDYCEIWINSQGQLMWWSR